MQSQVTPIAGQMMHRPLLISSILQYAAAHHPDVEIVSRRVEGDVHRYTYADCEARAKRLANALRALGVGMGDRVATLAWNGYRHLELYYAVSGSGAVLHTVNPRLHEEQVRYILGHAQSQTVFFDLTFLWLVEELAPHCPQVRAFVAMCGADDMPQTTMPNLHCYEELMAAADADYPWPVFDEHSAAGLCYTSGTTGNPKGVLYSHRSTLLHAYGAALPNALAISAADVVLPAVPMFHVNAWGLPYTAPLAGAKLVLPGPRLDGQSVYELIEQEQVTLAAGVPTVWLGLLGYLRDSGRRFSSFARVVIGGSACPPALMCAFGEDYQVEVIHAWGMTETSPVGAVSRLLPRHRHLAPEAQLAIRQKQGQAVFGIEMKIVDDDGQDLPRDGKTWGHLRVRGPWVLASYFGHGDDTPGDGWFATGDVVTLDREGYMHITDRSKDVIKSGGEWIGSIDLENIAASHPGVQQAACIGIFHPKWDERPLLVIEPRPGAVVTKEEVLRLYAGRVAKWWIPDDVVFVDALPLGATGKVLKGRLREQLKDYTPPSGLTAGEDGSGVVCAN